MEAVWKAGRGKGWEKKAWAKGLEKQRPGGGGDWDPGTLRGAGPLGTGRERPEGRALA